MKTLRLIIIATLLLSFAPIIINAQQKALEVGPNGNTTIYGTNTIIGQDATTGVKATLGGGRATDGYANLDLVSDVSNFSQYGTRLGRDVGGTFRFAHRGIKPLFFLTQDAGATIRFATSFATRMVITSDGRVGIGTNNPTSGYKFHVNGDACKPGGGMWATVSDRRLKKNIKPFEMGLETLMKLNPASWIYNGKGGITDTETEHIGFIAQEVKEVIPFAIKDYTYTPSRENLEWETYSEEVGETETYLSVDASSLPYITINAIKELHSIIEKQNEVIADLQQEIKETKQESFSTQSFINETNLTNQAILKQNVPNPSNGITRIEYYLPTTTKQANINIFDLTGKELKSVELHEKGMASVELNLESLPKGMYVYALIVDGTVVGSKQMILK